MHSAENFDTDSEEEKVELSPGLSSCDDRDDSACAFNDNNDHPARDEWNIFDNHSTLSS